MKTIMVTCKNTMRTFKICRRSVFHAAITPPLSHPNPNEFHEAIKSGAIPPFTCMFVYLRYLAF